jgi:hypothetical protein
MRTVAPEVKAIEHPVEFLDGQNDSLVGGVRRCFESFGLEALEPKAEPLRSQYKIFTRLRDLLRKTKSTGSKTATFISNSTSAARPSIDFRKSTGLGYRYTNEMVTPGTL